MARESESAFGVTSRRNFLMSSGALAVGASLGAQVSAFGAAETLAVRGGPKAVTVSSDGATQWPQYGEEEEKTLIELLHSPNYDPNTKLEEEWKEFLGAPFAREIGRAHV